MEQTCGRGLSVLGGGKFGAALGVVLTVIVDAGNKQQNVSAVRREAYLFGWKGVFWVRVCPLEGSLEGSWRGTGRAPATRERCSPESSALGAALPPALAPAVVELDMLEARDTLGPESFITMARHRRKRRRSQTRRRGWRRQERAEQRLQGASRGGRAELQAARDDCTFGGEVVAEQWRGGSCQASLSTTEKRQSHRTEEIPG